MAITVTPAASLAETVKNETNSPSTTTALTLKLLRSLLGLNEPVDPVSNSISKAAYDATTPTPAAKKIPTKTSSKNAKSINSRERTKFVICAVPQTSTSLSTDAQKLALATETFNKTLKHLSTASKSRKTAETCANNISYPNSSPTRLTRPNDGRPLHETSPNRQFKSLSTLKPKQVLTANHSLSDPGLMPTAECARISLDCLRGLEKNNTSAEDLQLERGSLILLENLNALKLSGLAIQEIHILKGRLDHKIRVADKTSIVSEQAVGRPSRCSSHVVPQSLRFDVMPTSETLCNLVISFQKQVLRTMAFSCPTAVSDPLVEALQLRCKYGPYAIILQGYNSNLLLAEKAGLHLHILAQAISTLCLSGFSASGKVTDGSTSSSPERVFQLQLVALEIQCSSWNLMKSQPCLERNLWTPFIRIVRKFCQTSALSKSELYALVRDSLQRLTSAFKTTLGDTSVHGDMQIPVLVNDYLAKLAQDCGCHAESIDILHRSLQTLNDTEGLASVICRCNIATLQLQVFTENPRAALAAVEEAIVSLRGSLKGSARELEDVLLHGVRLRKTAFDTLCKLSKSVNPTFPVDIEIKLRCSSTKVIFGVLYFVCRYIGRPLDDATASPEKMERFQQKLRLVRSIAEATINNTLIAVRLAIDSLTSIWAETDSALNDCLALARTLDQATDQTTEPYISQTTSSAFLKVSNIYWSQFLRIRDTSDPAELLGLLKSSIKALKGRPEPERQVGHLAVKYERIASIYTDLHKLDKAREALREAIAIHISFGPFQDIIGARSLHSMRSAWDSETSAIFAFGKTLTAFIKIHFLSDELQLRDTEYYDDEALSSEVRIALLARQLAIYMTLNPATSKLCSIAPLAQSILALHSQHQGVHRVQLLLSALKYASRHQDNGLDRLLEEQLSDNILNDLERNLRTNASPASYGISLLTSLRLQWAFTKSRPTIELLREMIQAWSSLASEIQDWHTFESQIQDPSFLSSQVQAVIDYTDMQGLSQLTLSALDLQYKILESRKPKDHATLATILIRMGLQSNHLGVTADAGKALALAKNCVDSLDSRPVIALEYHLALAAYLLNISNFEGYAQAFEVARSHYAVTFNDKVENGDQRFSSSQAKLLSQCASLTSQWQFERGDLCKAVFHAKQCVRLSSQIWAGMQREITSRPLQTTIETNESTIDSLVHDLSIMNISNNAANERPATKGATFWPHVSFHCKALMHLSYLLATCGLYQDAIYYADQAHRIAQAVDSRVFIFIASTLLLAHRRKGNDTGAGLGMSNTRLTTLEVEYAGMGIVSSYIYLAEASISAGNLNLASEAIDEATQYLLMIDPPPTTVHTVVKTAKPPAESMAESPMSPKSKTHTRARDRSTRKAVRAKSTRPRVEERPVSAAKGIAKSEEASSTTSANFKSLINVVKAHIMLNSDEGQDATSLLAKSKSVRQPRWEYVRRRLVEARTMLSEIFKSLSADAVHCVLAETTIAFPSLQKKERTPEKQVNIESLMPTRTPSRACRLGSTNGQTPIRHHKECDQPSDLAIRAAELLQETLMQGSRVCPTDMLRELSVMLNQCFMLSSVLQRQRNYTPMQVALQAALPNCSAIARESSVITTDVTLMNKSKVSSWPEIKDNDNSMVQLTSAHISSFEPGCLDKFPEQWNVISMQLGRTRDELSITKFHVGQPPFSLHIPLRRSGSDEADELGFGFAEARIELLEIIKMANKTAHDSGNQSDKQAKKVWWAEREALDDRLRTLLENIESIWLGGFRGILTHQHRHQDLLSRFSGSLLQSLNQHLPSRQKSRKSAGAGLRLHSHVLDLFVALGHPDERNLDDSITDLLYFVVDILQFQGEHNAYDEIDFDMITVEVADALRCYHEALRGLDVEHTQHTILILDKELLAFPWESLPCLDGRPVSRMPSLSCVESRLDKMRRRDVEASALSISANKGAYILNPSSDLASTQSMFAPAFSTYLPDFSSIINRAPTEAEFESYLREKELFLYFGHGSGAQYIRGRNIKRLAKCAVTFLMGCSSSKMAECGEFEPYGVPWNYMHASAPAVVGTLWDVTDKDIDRFAMKTFTEWGLIKEDAVAEEAARTKKKGKNVQGRARGRKQPTQPCPDRVTPKKVALDEAVANARSSCVLRYLNGAAPVIYGIPIVLG